MITQALFAYRSFQVRRMLSLRMISVLVPFHKMDLIVLQPSSKRSIVFDYDFWPIFV